MDKYEDLIEQYVEKFARTLFAKAFFCRILYLDGGRKGRQTLFSAGKNSVDNEVCGGGAECGMSC